MVIIGCDALSRPFANKEVEHLDSKSNPIVKAYIGK